MYMPDAIKATVQIMHAPAESVKIRGAYNIAGVSFDPKQIAEEIKKHIPDFKITYKPDFRQEIADTWPQSINDNEAREHWGWKNEFDLQQMVNSMLINLKK